MSVQTVVRGDARKLARRFQPPGPTVVITDPVWPKFAGVDAFQLLHTTLTHLVGKVSHVVILVGSTNDPRFVQAVPLHWPYWHTCALPSLTYVFGPPRRAQGSASDPGIRFGSPGALDDMRWLVRGFSRRGETVLDPFCGVGSTLVAAQEHHRDAVGWDSDRDRCALARQALRQPQLFDAHQAGAGA
jgi:hypothetical protein